jgi:hypothetical protein
MMNKLILNQNLNGGLKILPETWQRNLNDRAEGLNVRHT